jgi:hypothetical protein
MDGAKEFDFARFHLIGEGFTRGALRVRARAELPADPQQLTRGEAAVVEPIVFDHDQGTRPHDFVGTTWAALDLVSDRFIDVLRDGRFTGWDTYPVVIVGKDGEEVAAYHGLAITGRCGRVEWEKSERVILPPPVPQGRATTGWRGLYFSPSSWDGSDLFVPSDGSTYVIVTDAVKAAIEKRRLTNIHFKRLTEFDRNWNQTPDGKLIFGTALPP